MFKKNSKASHQAVITLSIEIMERLKDGRISGLPVKTDNKLYTIIGKTLEECEIRTKQFIQRLDN